MKFKLLLVSAVFVAALYSCKKQGIENAALSSLRITNAVVDGENLQFGTNLATVNKNSSTAYSILAGNRQIKLATKDAPDVVYYDQTSNFVNGGVYSLFLTGTSNAVEPVMVKEENILPYTGNVFGVRIINLSLNNAAISVNIVDSANGSLFPGVEYKTITDFKEVSAIAEEGDKTFEFRNALTGDLISSFVVPGYDMPRFRNITLVFAGTAGNEVIFRVNNY